MGVFKSILASSKYFQFLKILKENVAIFSKVFKILSNFSQKFRQKFGKFKKYASLRGLGEKPPELENLFKI